MRHPAAVAITGCSGGGKSSLIDELARRGWATVPEPGRRIVAEELAGDGRALPWVDPRAFAERAYAMALADLAKAGAGAGWAMFDRGLIDAAVAREHSGGPRATDDPLLPDCYHGTVFFAPAWPDIYVNDGERRHGLPAAIAEAERLALAYTALGYRLVELPRASVSERAAFVVAELGAG